MKKIQLISMAAYLCFFMMACSGNNNANASEEVKSITESAPTSGEDVTSEENNCLLNYADKYDELLTEEMVLNASGFPKDKLKFKYSKALKNTSYHSVSYDFMMGRKQIIPGMKDEMALPDYVKLKGIRANTLDKFKDSHRAMTAEEEQQFQETKKEVLAGKSGNKQADKALSELEKKGVTKEQTENITDNLSSVMKDITKAYVVVDGLGDAARWNTMTKDLYVIKGGVEFCLSVNISADDAANKAKAVDLGRQILDKCK